MNWQRTVGLLLVGGGLVVLALKLGHIYDPAPVIERLGAKGGPKVTQAIRNAQPNRVVYGALVIFPVCLGAIFLFSASRKTKESERDLPIAAPLKADLKPTRKQAAVHSCNVLQIGAEA